MKLFWYLLFLPALFATAITWMNFQITEISMTEVYQRVHYAQKINDDENIKNPSSFHQNFVKK